MNQKRIILLLILTMVTLLLAGCGEEIPIESDSISSTKTTAEDTSIYEHAGENASASQSTPAEEPEDESVFAPEVEESTFEHANSTQESVDEDGTIFEDETDVWIQNEDGEIIASYSNGDFDFIASYGDGYYALCRDRSGFDSTGYEIGILRIDGTWAVDYFAPTDAFYSSEYVTLLTTNAKKEGIPEVELLHVLEYCGSGVFCYRKSGSFQSQQVSYHFISCSTLTEFEIDNIDYYYNECGEANFFKNEYTCFLGFPNDACYIVGLNGVITNLGKKVTSIGSYSDGGFVYYQNNELFYYDCVSGTSTMICPDSDKLRQNRYQFKDGQLEITLTGSDGQTYYAIVDKQGNYIEEPHQ